MKYIIILLVAAASLASLASGQLIYDEVRVTVAPGVTCPSGWTAQSEQVTTETRFSVSVPASIGGGGAAELLRGLRRWRA